jgi:hypothetical protein
VRKLIERLLTTQSAQQKLDALPQSDLDELNGNPASKRRAIETFNRGNTERAFAAMSLAARLFYVENNRWPASADELAPRYIPEIPIDPWGNGTQRLGYVLLKAALPDGADRPMVYSRSESRDGLLVRFDQPLYSFYTGDGSSAPRKDQKQGGQFRDLSRWVPDSSKPAPTTQPLER